MREKIKIAVIGCGRFSGSFIPLWKAHRMVEKVYVCDLIKERAEQFSRDYGVEIIESFEAALASDEINSIAIFTQRFTHGEMAIRALKAGKHVYSSVPCAVSIDEIKEIERLVRKTRLTNSMGETGFYRGPPEFTGLDNRHNGTHHFLIDDFCRAYETGKLSPCNIWQVARFNIPGLMAHESALRNGETLDVIDLGDPPADWEVLTEETMRPYNALSSH